MTDWIIVHDPSAHAEHPEHVGRTIEKPPRWITEMKCGDRIVYYTTGEGYVMDLGIITRSATMGGGRFLARDLG